MENVVKTFSEVVKRSHVLLNILLTNAVYIATSSRVVVNIDRRSHVNTNDGKMYNMCYNMHIFVVNSERCGV